MALLAYYYFMVSLTWEMRRKWCTIKSGGDESMMMWRCPKYSRPLNLLKSSCIFGFVNIWIVLSSFHNLKFNGKRNGLKRESFCVWTTGSENGTRSKIEINHLIVWECRHHKMEIFLTCDITLKSGWIYQPMKPWETPSSFLRKRNRLLTYLSAMQKSNNFQALTLMSDHWNPIDATCQITEKKITKRREIIETPLQTLATWSADWN